MDDTIELRDHSQPCEHTGGDWEDGPWRMGAYDTDGVWECFVDGCPGGKKIVMQATWALEYGGQTDDDSILMWVEVCGE